MPRIRSVHPGLFTDEAFASLSSDAQVFLIGLWTEADDQGVFEWKPVSLRMRLRPTKDGDVAPFLAELESANCIASYEHGGRKYGAIRNFRRFQRPKRPNSAHFIPPEFRTYVGLSQSIPEQELDDEAPFRTMGETAEQMEDGEKEEGEGKEKKKDNIAPNGAPKTKKKYAFEGGVIKLTAADFSKWQGAFSHLDLRAELVALEYWAGKQADWFHAVKHALAKRNREQRRLAEKSATGPPSNGEYGVDRW